MPSRPDRRPIWFVIGIIVVFSVILGVWRAWVHPQPLW